MPPNPAPTLVASIRLSRRLTLTSMDDLIRLNLMGQIPNCIRVYTHSPFPESDSTIPLGDGRRHLKCGLFRGKQLFFLLVLCDRLLTVATYIRSLYLHRCPGKWMESPTPCSGSGSAMQMEEGITGSSMCGLKSDVMVAEGM